MFKKMISIVAVAGLVLALAPAAQAGLMGQLGKLDEAWFAANPINPDTTNPWQAGDTYHLAFTTLSKTIASIAPPTAPYDDITYYDAIVQGDADAAGVGAGVGVTWKVIGSTLTVNARDHAAVSAPVYDMQGTPIASNYADLWDGSIANPITFMDGTVGPDYQMIWTGSNANGTTKAGYELGTTTRFAWAGRQPRTTSAWISDSKQDFWRAYTLYGLSEPLQVVPEPATLALLGLGGLGLILRRRRK